VHACVLQSDGSVGCWGDNMFGELGDGTTAQRDVPTQVSL
jgi:alpha-tubulin suppressor-like RCC1 family protein